MMILCYWVGGGEKVGRESIQKLTAFFAKQLIPICIVCVCFFRIHLHHQRSNPLVCCFHYYLLHGRGGPGQISQFQKVGNDNRLDPF
jgi:hypothetical protein